MLLTADEHCIGRIVENTRFQIESNAVSANHCKIYRRRLAPADDSDYSVFLKDTRLFLRVFLSFFLFCLFTLYFLTNSVFWLQHKWDLSQLGEVEEK
jgi:hypothetical protein